MRNLLDVLTQMEDAIPYRFEGPNLIIEEQLGIYDKKIVRGIKNIKGNVLYAPPEATKMWWDNTSILLSKFLPKPYEALSGWHKKVVDIFVGKE